MGKWRGTGRDDGEGRLVRRLVEEGQARWAGPWTWKPDTTARFDGDGRALVYEHAYQRQYGFMLDADFFAASADVVRGEEG